MSGESLSRRSLLSGLGLAAMAGVAGFAVAKASSLSGAKNAAAGANGYGYQPPPAPSSGGGGGGGHFLARLDQVPGGGGGLVLASDGVVLVRDASGVHGLSSTCTHQGCTVASVERNVITCPCHGSQFDARTGKVVNGPATSPLPAVAVVVRGDSVYTGS
ncbi:MAG TPA: Rieske (2Fe-2S) protein [Acidimicrobiales bacterium]|nr:Rieske (2Fe-2S) protein [Acidimicrobiales bacterium]